MSETIVLNFSRTRIAFTILLLVFLNVLIVVAFFVVTPFLKSIFLAVFLVIMLLLLSFATLRLFVYFNYARRKIPALILSQAKLTDNMNEIAFNWKDIDSFSTELVKLAYIIRINTIDKSKYIRKIKNPIIRELVKLKLLDYFIIQTNILELRTDKILDILITFHQSVKKL